MIFGVNAWFTRPRSRSCSGGSVPIMLGGRSMNSSNPAGGGNLFDQVDAVAQHVDRVLVAEQREHRQARVAVDAELAPARVERERVAAGGVVERVEVEGGAHPRILPRLRR